MDTFAMIFRRLGSIVIMRTHKNKSFLWLFMMNSLVFRVRKIDRVCFLDTFVSRNKSRWNIIVWRRKCSTCLSDRSTALRFLSIIRNTKKLILREIQHNFIDSLNFIWDHCKLLRKSSVLVLKLFNFSQVVHLKLENSVFADIHLIMK